MTSIEKYSEIKDGLLFLLSDSSGVLNDKETKEILHFMDVNEYGLALETFVDILIDEKKFISNQSYKKVEELASMMCATDDLDINLLQKQIKNAVE